MCVGIIFKLQKGLIMKLSVKLLSFLIVACLLLTSCQQGALELADINEKNEFIKNDSQNKAEYLSASNDPVDAEKGTYNEGVVLVKCDGKPDSSILEKASVRSAEPVYNGSDWYILTLNEGDDTVEKAEELSKLGCFDKVDLDYIMKTDGEISSVDISGNEYADDLTYLDTLGVKKGWEHNANNKKYPGGSPDVIIAIIDTGVDYNHLDLKNNIWVNSAEIPGNNVDDDGNGYVDDINGWDCVGNDNDPMDDNGHGTHVAGIAAAENNKAGTVGIAYNCKIMVLKAGNSSGYFNNSDIAEAVQYAYMNGASVINMSFGGSSVSMAVEEALENAYEQCVLVAAAGNDALCNNISCPTHDYIGVCYPAALPYVIGVMSCNSNGSSVSPFSNFDHYPYNTVEYDVYACGENIPSTWPGNKYASLSGTSMACPTVAGIAAVLRSSYSDREVYSNKFIQSQIVNTGTKAVLAHTVADLNESLTKLPTPNVNLYDHHINDSTDISDNNNGNGVVDAGETIRLSVSLHNRGGVASDVNVSIDTKRHSDASLTDPYFTIVNDTIELSDIGTYSVRESGDEKYFEIVVSPDCPNDYLSVFNVHYTYKNGMDENDTTVYTDDGKQSARFSVSRGYHLPSIISEDTVYESDRLYIVGDNVTIPADVTVTFKEGCEIQFYDDREYYNSPVITVYGTLNISGTKDNMVSIHPSESHSAFVCGISNCGTLNISYADAINLISGIQEKYFKTAITTISDSLLKTSPVRMGANRWLYYYSDAKAIGHSFYELTKTFSTLSYNAMCESSYYYRNYIVLDYQGAPFSAKYASDNIFFVYGDYGDIAFGISNDNVFFTSGIISDYGELSVLKEAKNNRFTAVNEESSDLVKLNFVKSGTAELADNEFSPAYIQYASQIIEGYLDSTGTPIVDVYGSLADASILWPYVVSVEMFDADGNPVNKVGKEEITVRVTFNRPMDVEAETYLTFGTIEPYGDYRINGEYISETVWEGTYTLKAQIENGQNYIKVNNAWAKEDKTKTVFGEYQLHEFTIDTTAAMAMNLRAEPKDEGIQLTFAQDDYDTLLGYNIYRSEDKDGNFVKLNPTVIPPEEDTFLDENAEPGKTYWYTYTVVLSDFTESNPAGKVVATAKDTMSPSLYHTPVNQGYLNNNLVISCTASDNVGIESVTLYYRAIGSESWKSLSMLKQNDKYSATIFGSELSASGLEYYIVASDSVNSISKGTADVPYKVVIKDADSITHLGDVDGDNTVTTKDALMLMQALNEEILLSDDEFKRADLNKDNLLSGAEALRILQYINGNVTTLEM